MTTHGALCAGGVGRDFGRLGSGRLEAVSERYVRLSINIGQKKRLAPHASVYQASAAPPVYLQTMAIHLKPVLLGLGFQHSVDVAAHQVLGLATFRTYQMVVVAKVTQLVVQASIL
jgi:hypothetical protein